MKRFLILGFMILGAAKASHATIWEETPIDNGGDPGSPSPEVLEEIYKQDTAKWEQLVHIVNTDDYYSGRTTEMSFRGVNYVIDRTNEPLRVEAIKPNSPSIPGGAASILAIVKDLRSHTKAGGAINIRVYHREFNQDGKIISEDSFEIDMSGAWEAELGGMSDANDKSHK